MMELRRRTNRARRSTLTNTSTPAGMRVTLGLAIKDVPTTPAAGALVRIWWWGAAGAVTPAVKTGTTVQAPVPGTTGSMVLVADATGTVSVEFSSAHGADDAVPCAVEVVGETERTIALAFDHA